MKTHKMLFHRFRYLEEGESIPFYYGYAWYDIEKGEMITYPIPLNLILRFFRCLILRMRLGTPRLDVLEKAHRQGYERGWIAGWNEAHKEIFMGEHINHDPRDKNSE